MADQNVSYLNRDFEGFKANLINYAKTYFPNTVNDFTDSNPGNMFIEMAAYLGDVMSFYLDTQVQENNLLFAKERENLFAISYVFGYQPKASYASSTDLDVYQVIPSITVSGSTSPDYSTYGLLIPKNTVVSSLSTNIKFLTLTDVDFTDETNNEVTLVDSNYYLVKKVTKVMSAEIKEVDFTFTNAEKFTNIEISDDNILQILEVTDSSDNQWYEVPYLAQATIFEQVVNPNYNSDGIPYLVKLKRVPRRFISRLRSDGTLQLEFGAGISNKNDTQIIPTPDNISLGLVPGISTLENNYNKASVLFTQEYGLAPSSTTLTIKYLVGGGILANVPSNDITNIVSTIDNSYFKNGIPANTPVANHVLTSIAVNNQDAASGGRGADEVEEIRNNALYSYSTQMRSVTKDDYMIRALSLPSEYGNISKAYVTQNLLNETETQNSISITNLNNPLSLDLYILAYDSDKKLINASTTLKNNLVTYINQYRIATDAINIKDAFYINIGLNFEITVNLGYNNNDVLQNCISSLKNYFNIEQWQVNQPIVISDISSILLQVKGVQSVIKIEFVNKQDNTGDIYSRYGYDIAAATRKNIIYPSMDPSIFEVRYPNTDLFGRVSA